MSGRRISKRALASPGDIVMVGLWVPPPVTVRNFFGKGRAVAGDRPVGLRPQYLSYCSGCHSGFPDATARRGDPGFWFPTLAKLFG
ncbi:hypothetical protein AVEN_117169-1 [Araneus ventricosus]|uniref:Uncharacterized protein n=1 Tax=Araneus ventricosus TaxID=182803 RepID=A0A4Y2AWH2_ARAVE|nr:hypothetical protein AVEN_117169-1 [Araneus ventricosus]